MAKPDINEILGELRAAQVHQDTGQPVAQRQANAGEAVTQALPGYAEEMAPLSYGRAFTPIDFEDYWLLAHGKNAYEGGEDVRQRQADLSKYLNGGDGQRLFVHSTNNRWHHIDTGIITGPAHYILSTEDRLVAADSEDFAGAELVREYNRPMFTVPLKEYAGGVFDSTGLFASRRNSSFFDGAPDGEFAITGWCDLGERPATATIPDIAIGSDIEDLVDELSSKHSFLVGSLRQAWESLLSDDFPEPPAPPERRKSKV